ncbi:hypothetical protein BDU57DRAFT_436902 [Ampelomyces quisqualis]|uniref:Uncharacterized protein n=1 Tax=Ampelomyces quisqualis TaxID=50730 RepID=A0A6A5R4W5_AMPQU|nr:hypothetical protein BDU57DRAFT_436902 [Ampelomyces quisqualis]
MYHHVKRSPLLAASTSATHTLIDRASRVLVARATCTNDTDDGCRKPTQVPTIAIAMAAIVPIVGLLVVLVFLHRRNKKKLAAEDAKDKYKSLDFGLEGAGPMKRGKTGGPEMKVTEKEIRGGHDRGLSLEAGSPYILPVGLHGSRESFHSLSRSHNDPHDPYRPVTFLNDNQSVRSQSRAYGHDNGSLYTTSSGDTQKHRMNDGLLRNAQRMSTSHPMRGESLSPDGARLPDVKFPEQNIPLSPLNPRFENEPVAISAHQLPDSTAAHAASSPPDVPIIAVPAPAPAARERSHSPEQTPAEPSHPFRVQSQQAVVLENVNTTSMISTSSSSDGFQVTPPSPRESLNMTQGRDAPQPLRPQSPTLESLGVDEFGHGNNRLSIMRPLPPDDPEENPAQRAERIRSFYKEYFDDSKPEPVGGHSYTDYYEDYGSEYHQDGALFDPKSRGFVAAQPNAPFAAPVTRRAMTPPPRAPPRFRSNNQTGPRGTHMSNSSSASSNYGPRIMSSMSGRLPASGPRKPLPPPSALLSLPTPAKLSADAMVFNPLDFAPPVSFRDRQNGMRPDSPLGSPRPFSPAVRPHTPLASSFDDLPVMPSPHMLRKSGLFTGLDFAPPPKFRDPGSNASDAGSIRSNRSGMSAAGRYAVANGANRVSKIPKDMVFTRDDMMSQLRPKLDMVSKA